MSCERLETAVSGDVDDVRELVLSGGMSNTDLAAVLADVGTTLAAQVWNDDHTAEPLTVTVVDAARRIVALNLGGPSGWLATANVDEYLVDVTVTATSGTWTFPSAAPLRLLVRASG